MDIENIKKIIQEIIGIKVREIKGEDVLVYSKNPQYRIEIEKGGIYLQARDDNNFTMERYWYSINEAGNLSVKATKYKKGYFGYEVSEKNDIEYDNNGIEQKREAMKLELDKWNRRKLSEHVITERHAVYPFIAVQSLVVSNGRKCEDTKPKYKLLDLNTVDSLSNLAQIDSGENILFQGVPEIDRYYQKHRVTVDAMLKVCGIGNENQEIR